MVGTEAPPALRAPPAGGQASPSLHHPVKELMGGPRLRRQVTMEPDVTHFLVNDSVAYDLVEGGAGTVVMWDSITQRRTHMRRTAGDGSLTHIGGGAPAPRSPDAHFVSPDPRHTPSPAPPALQQHPASTLHAKAASSLGFYRSAGLVSPSPAAGAAATPLGGGQHTRQSLQRSASVAGLIHRQQVGRGLQPSMVSATAPPPPARDRTASASTSASQGHQHYHNSHHHHQQQQQQQQQQHYQRRHQNGYDGYDVHDDDQQRRGPQQQQHRAPSPTHTTTASSFLPNVSRLGSNAHAPSPDPQYGGGGGGGGFNAPGGGGNGWSSPPPSGAASAVHPYPHPQQQQRFTFGSTLPRAPMPRPPVIRPIAFSPSWGSSHVQPGRGGPSNSPLPRSSSISARAHARSPSPRPLYAAPPSPTSGSAFRSPDPTAPFSLPPPPPQQRQQQQQQQQPYGRSQSALGVHPGALQPPPSPFVLQPRQRPVSTTPTSGLGGPYSGAFHVNPTYQQPTAASAGASGSHPLPGGGSGVAAAAAPLAAAVKPAVATRMTTAMSKSVQLELMRRTIDEAVEAAVGVFQKTSAIKLRQQGGGFSGRGGGGRGGGGNDDYHTPASPRRRAMAQVIEEEDSGGGGLLAAQPSRFCLADMLANDSATAAPFGAGPVSLVTPRGSGVSATAAAAAGATASQSMLQLEVEASQGALQIQPSWLQPTLEEKAAVVAAVGSSGGGLAAQPSSFGLAAQPSSWRITTSPDYAPPPDGPDGVPAPLRRSTVALAKPPPAKAGGGGKWAKLGGGFAGLGKNSDVGGGAASKANAFIAILQAEDQLSLTAGARQRTQRFGTVAEEAMKRKLELDAAEGGGGGGGGAATRPRRARINMKNYFTMMASASQIPNLRPEQSGMLMNSEVSQVFEDSSPVLAEMAGLAKQTKDILLRTSKHQEQRRAVVEELVRDNPVAFFENAAQDSEAEYRSFAERARRRLDGLAARPASAGGSSGFVGALQGVRMARPFFRAPTAHPKERSVRLPTSLKGEKDEPAPEAPLVREWNIDESIFWQRRRECDARDYYDNDKVLGKQFTIDWSRIVGKVKFRRLVSREDSAVRDHSELDRELNEIHDELYERARIIRSAFVYYSLSPDSDSSSLNQMGLLQFGRFAKECGIIDPKSAGCRASDLDLMFIATNFEEEDDTLEAEVNDDDKLCRFEFYEIIVRLAFGKYIRSGLMTDASDSVGALVDNIIAPNLPPLAKVDPDDFRRQRFYTREMEGLILAHMDLIQAVYRVYKARDRTKFFWIEHWMAMLESTGLLSEVTGLTNYSAKLIYCWSQLAVTDELRRRQRSVSLAFFDFIEGLARLAEFISPPSPADLRAFYEATGPPETAFPVAEYYQRMAWERPEVQTSARRPSAGLHGSESATRPLADKFSAFMELFLEGLKHAWGGSNEAQVIKRMTAMAKMLGGGMELD